MSLSRQVHAQAKPASATDAEYIYVSQYLGGGEAHALLGWLLANADWRTERLKLFGRSIVVPRLVAWYGDPGVSYRYSGIDHDAVGWPPSLASLVRTVRAEFAPGTNFLLVNRYRCGADSMGWHTDDEPALAGPVVSISLGAVRRFHLRTAVDAGTINLDLAHGSLLIHPRDCPHAVPKTRRRVGERINLSFRTISV